MNLSIAGIIMATIPLINKCLNYFPACYTLSLVMIKGGLKPKYLQLALNVVSAKKQVVKQRIQTAIVPSLRDIRTKRGSKIYDVDSDVWSYGPDVLYDTL